MGIFIDNTLRGGIRRKVLRGRLVRMPGGLSSQEPVAAIGP